MLERKIIWIDYEENYRKSKGLQDEELDDIIDDGDDDEEEEKIDEMLNRLSVGVINKVENTPWGQFLEDDPMSPVNFYSLKLVHFFGFRAESILNIEQTLDSVEGIARWRSIDPYCLIIAKAKLYEWRDVMYNFEVAILGPKPTPAAIKKIAKEIIKENKEKNIERYTVIIMPDGSVVQANTDDEKNMIDSLSKNAKGIVVVKDGTSYGIN